MVVLEQKSLPTGCPKLPDAFVACARKVNVALKRGNHFLTKVMLVFFGVLVAIDFLGFPRKE